MNDLISREAILEMICAHWGVFEAWELPNDAQRVCGIVKAATAVTPEVKRGRWLDGRCTVCGWEEPDSICYDGYEQEVWIHTDFCPQCGSYNGGLRDD